MKIPKFPVKCIYTKHNSPKPLQLGSADEKIVFLDRKLTIRSNKMDQLCSGPIGFSISRDFLERFSQVEFAGVNLIAHKRLLRIVGIWIFHTGLCGAKISSAQIASFCPDEVHCHLAWAFVGDRKRSNRRNKQSATVQKKLNISVDLVAIFRLFRESLWRAIRVTYLYLTLSSRLFVEECPANLATI